VLSNNPTGAVVAIPVQHTSVARAGFEPAISRI
jgi:hypothetical protein